MWISEADRARAAQRRERYDAALLALADICSEEYGDLWRGTDGRGGGVFADLTAIMADRDFDVRHEFDRRRFR